MTESVDQVAFRGALGRFASGVTVVSTVDEGVDHAMAASAFCSVSMDPPLILICVDRTNRFHDAVSASKSWAVSLLDEDAQEAATWFATRGRPLENQFDRVPHHRGKHTRAALVDAALAWIECTTWQAYDGGDHTILLGEVVSAAVREAVDQPLLYYRSHYGSLVRSTASEKTDLPDSISDRLDATS